MRRMLDPTKIGGGGDNKLYKHTINCYSSTYGTVYLTIYNKSIEQINSESKFKNAILSIGSVIATGYIKYGNNVFNVYYSRFSESDNKVIVFGYRINNEGNLVSYSTFIDRNFSTFEDNVSEVR